MWQSTNFNEFPPVFSFAPDSHSGCIVNEPKWSQFLPIALLYRHPFNAEKNLKRWQTQNYSSHLNSYFVNQMGSFIEKSGFFPSGADRNIPCQQFLCSSRCFFPSHRIPFLQWWKTNPHKHPTQRERFQTKHILKTNFMSLFKLPLKYLWVRKLEDYRWWGNRLKSKVFLLLLHARCVVIVVAHRRGALGPSGRQMEWRFVENYRR